MPSPELNRRLAVDFIFRKHIAVTADLTSGSAWIHQEAPARPCMPYWCPIGNPPCHLGNQYEYKTRSLDSSDFRKKSSKRKFAMVSDPRTVLKALDKKGFLRREARAMTISTLLPEMGKIRVYCIRSTILSHGVADASDD
jgi:hypothetical protein